MCKIVSHFQLQLTIVQRFTKAIFIAPSSQYELVIDLRSVLTDSDFSQIRERLVSSVDPIQKDPIQKNDSFTNRTSPLCWLDCSRSSERERDENHCPATRQTSHAWRTFTAEATLKGCHISGGYRERPCCCLKSYPQHFSRVFHEGKEVKTNVTRRHFFGSDWLGVES